MPSRLEPHYEYRNFLRNNLTDLNSSAHTGADLNWIFADPPSGERISTDVYPRIKITKIPSSATIIGIGEDTTDGPVSLQVDITCHRFTGTNGILTKTNTDESIGVISNSPRISFDDVPNSVTNIKHTTTAFGTVTAKNNDASFTTPGSLSAGTVEWSRETGNLNFSSADLTSYSGETITSTYVLNLDSEMVVKWIGREIVRKTRTLWRTDDTIGSLREPELSQDVNLLPFDIERDISRAIVEYQFKRFNIGE